MQKNHMVSGEHEEVISVKKSSTGSAGIANILRHLLKKWWLFVIVGLLAGLGGYLYAAAQKPSYKSKLTFALDDGGSGGSMGGFASLASQFGLNMGGGKDIFSGENITEIMKSRRMVEAVLLSTDTFNNKAYTLIEYYLDIAGFRKPGSRTAAIHFPIGQPRAQFNYQQDSLLKKVYADLVSDYIQAKKPDRKLNIFEVNVTSASEKLSKVFTERLVNETNKFYIEIRTRKAKETLSALENRVAAMKGNLNTSISSRAAVQDANVNPAFAAAQVPVMQQQANIQAYGGAYTEMFKNLEIARFQYLNDIPLLQIIDAPDYPMEKIKPGKLKTAILFAVLFDLVLMIILWIRWGFRTNPDTAF